MQLSETQELTMKMAKAGYESYAAYTGNKSAVTSYDLPKWEQLPGRVINAWFAAADGMTKFLASVDEAKVEIRMREALMEEQGLYYQEHSKNEHIG